MFLYKWPASQMIVAVDLIPSSFCIFPAEIFCSMLAKNSGVVSGRSKLSYLMHVKCRSAGSHRFNGLEYYHTDARDPGLR